MSISRRRFIRLGCVTSATLPLTSDLFIKAIASDISVSEEDYARNFHHFCAYTREEDLLNLYFYFINLQLKNGKLEKVNNGDIYIVVRLPQQHVGEEYVLDDSSSDEIQKTRKKAFVSGFSFLTFRFSTNKRTFGYTPEFLLDWQRFELLTISDSKYGFKNSTPVIEVEREPGIYPFEAEKQNDLSEIEEKIKPFYTKANGVYIPVTHFEVPYKMFLSPFVSKDEMKDYSSFKFSFNDENSQKQYLKNIQTSAKTQSRLIELWRNSFTLKLSEDSNNYIEQNPSFRVLGYAKPDKFDGGSPLLPELVHRENLAALSRLDTDNASRNIKSNYFDITGLGISTFLKYNNPDPNSHSLVSWKQHIVQGRDNKVEITIRGIEVNSCLKVLISLITERRIRYGVSYLKKRYYVKYLEPEKNFDTPTNIFRTPLKSIRALETGTYCFPKSLMNSDNKPSGLAYALLEEQSKPGEVPDYPKDLIKMPYSGIDQNGKEHFFEMDMIVIPAELYKVSNNSAQPYTYAYEEEEPIIYNKGSDYINLAHTGLIGDTETNPNVSYDHDEYKVYKKEALRVVNYNKAKNYPNHQVIFENKLAFADSSELKSNSEQSVNTEFETKGVLFYAHEGGEFNSDYPLYPRLWYARAFIPQLGGIESVPKLHTVGYSAKYFEHGLNSENNPSQIFLKPLAKNYSLDSVTKILESEESFNKAERISPAGDLIFNELTKQYEGIKNSFTENYKNIGSMINPDIEIEGVSIKEQGLALKDKVENLAQFNPLEFLGEDAELIGSVSISKILKEALDLKDLPITKAIEDTAKQFAQIEELFKNSQEILDQWRRQYQGYKTIIEEFPQKLDRLQKGLVQSADSLVTKYVSKYIEKNLLYQQLTLLKRNDYFLLKKKVEEAYNTYMQLFQAKLEIHVKPLINWWNAKGSQLIQLINETQVNLPAADLFKKIRELTGLILEMMVIAEQILSAQPAEKIKAISYAIKVFYINKLKEFIIKKENNVVKFVDTRLEPIQNALDDAKLEMSDELERQHRILNDTIAEIENFSYQYYSNLEKQVKEELKILSEQVEENINAKLTLLKRQLLNSEAVVLLKGTIDNYISIYNEARGRITEAKKIVKELNLEQAVFDQLSAQESAIKGQADQYITELKSAANEIINKPDYISLIGMYNQKIDDLERNILDQIDYYNQHFSDFFASVNAIQIVLENELNREKKRILDSINLLKNEYNEAKDRGENFIKNQITDLKNKANKAKSELRKAIEDGLGNERIREFKKTIDLLQNYINKIESASKKEIVYSWQTTSFKSRSFGTSKFIKRNDPPTELSVDFKSTTHFDLSLNKPPSISKQEFFVKNRLSNFGVNFFNLLTVNFNEIAYQNGSSVKEDFSVKVRDIQFDGVLNFIEAFQKYLQSLDKNIQLEINSRGVLLGYSIPLSNLLFGYINFYKLKLYMAISLPFQPKVPMLLKFGINNPTNRFLVTVNGYPGSGYFVITLDPNKGVVGIDFLIEFGAHLYFNIGVAKGNAYLYAGFYYIKRRDFIEFKGYLVCGGNLNILNIFSATITFHLYLRGNGKYLEGKATLRIKYRVTRWFKISVRLSLYKRFYGTPDNSVDNRSNPGNKKMLGFLNEELINQNDQFLELFESDILLESNITPDKELMTDDEVYVIVKTENAPQLLLNDPNANVTVNNLYTNDATNETYFELIGVFNTPGVDKRIEIEIGDHKVLLADNVTVISTDDEEEPEMDFFDDKLLRYPRTEWKRYFKSYF